MQLYLASASPRRRELISYLPYSYTILENDFDEEAFYREWRSACACLNITLFSRALAEAKAKHAYTALIERGLSDFVVLAADTIVVLDEQIYGKPVDNAEALEMLKDLQGQTHRVMTSVCLIDSANELCSDIAITDVRFADNSEEFLRDYIENYHVLDKAGAYAIQDRGALLVEGIVGDYYNVVGLPIRLVYNLLDKYSDVLIKV